MQSKRVDKAIDQNVPLRRLVTASVRLKPLKANPKFFPVLLLGHVLDAISANSFVCCPTESS
jgi:hypothetical protein